MSRLGKEIGKMMPSTENWDISITTHKNSSTASRKRTDFLNRWRCNKGIFEIGMRCNRTYYFFSLTLYYDISLGIWGLTRWNQGVLWYGKRAITERMNESWGTRSGYRITLGVYTGNIGTGQIICMDGLHST